MNTLSLSLSLSLSISLSLSLCVLSRRFFNLAEAADMALLAEHDSRVERAIDFLGHARLLAHVCVALPRLVRHGTHAALLNFRLLRLGLRRQRLLCRLLPHFVRLCLRLRIFACAREFVRAWIGSSE